jgi:hypothetical protein
MHNGLSTEAEGLLTKVRATTLKKSKSCRRVPANATQARPEQHYVYTVTVQPYIRQRCTALIQESQTRFGNHIICNRR